MILSDEIVFQMLLSWYVLEVPMDTVLVILEAWVGRSMLCVWIVVISLLGLTI